MRGRGIDKTGSLWAITSYFNPAGYRNRLANYRIFRERLAVPLVTVELSFGAEFELSEGDADILVQLRGGDVMWQKERLLNIALTALPDTCDRVAWLDCDVVFELDDWPDQLCNKLDEFAIVQVFSRIYHLPRDSRPCDVSKQRTRFSQASFAEAISSGERPEFVLSNGIDRVTGSYAPGSAWAARREILDRHGFYDCGIIGGADTALVCAAYGFFGIEKVLHKLNARQAACFENWAKPFHVSVAGAVSNLDGSLFHLWHGDSVNRRWRERHVGLGAFAFDPYEDIKIGENGAWQWASAKPDLHAYVRDYFLDRKEDG